MALLTLLLGAAAEGKCAKEGIAAFPAPGSVIPLNSWLILEGVGAEQARVSSLVGRDLLLRAPDDSVSVRVETGWRSAKGRTAVVLKPQRRLLANRLYSLLVEAYLPNSRVLGSGGPEALQWRSGDSADEKPPSYLLRPAVSEGLGRGEGEQTVRWVKLHATLAEESPAYLVITLRRARVQGSSQVYFAPLKGGEALLGHDECSGSFAFEDGRAYKATVEAFDASGNPGPRLAALELHAPRAEE